MLRPLLIWSRLHYLNLLPSYYKFGLPLIGKEKCHWIEFRESNVSNDELGGRQRTDGGLVIRIYQYIHQISTQKYYGFWVRGIVLIPNRSARRLLSSSFETFLPIIPINHFTLFLPSYPALDIIWVLLEQIRYNVSRVYRLQLLPLLQKSILHNNSNSIVLQPLSL